jgi:hypothetical protein
MKTPREILMERHQAVEPRLDAMRRSVVAELNNKETGEHNFPAFFVSSLVGCSNKLWLELILPCRRIWTGLATVWILLFIVNVSQHDSSQARIAKSAPPAVMMTLGDQQRILNELFADRSFASDADRPKIFSPKPRTETLKLSIV